MNQALPCPTCDADLVVQVEDALECPEGHRYTHVGLALANNLAAVRALWAAIHALEDDAAGLTFMASKQDDPDGPYATLRRAEAQASLEAADTLRRHARSAQERLDALPVAPSTVTEEGSQRGRGG